MVLETNDLIIRPTEWEDLDEFCQWEQKPEVTKFFSIRDSQTMEDVVRKYIADDMDPKAQQFTILLKEGAGSTAGGSTAGGSTAGGSCGGVGCETDCSYGGNPAIGAGVAGVADVAGATDVAGVAGIAGVADDGECPATRKIGRIVLADIEDGWKAEIWRIYIADTNLRGRGFGKQAMEAMLGYCFDILGLQRVYLDHYTGNPAAGLYLSLGFKYEGVLRQNCRKNGVLYDVHLMSMLRDEYEALYAAGE